MGAGELGAIHAEVRADVAEAGGGEQGVDDRVGDGVSVAVTREGDLARPFEPGEPQRAVTAERVHVGPDAHLRTPLRRGSDRGREGTLRDDRPRALEVGGRRDLERRRVALDGEDRMTGGCHRRGVIGVVVVRAAQRRLEHIATEPLGVCAAASSERSTAAITCPRRRRA